MVCDLVHDPYIHVAPMRGAERKRCTMTTFMDLHNMDGSVSADDAAAAHQANLKIQAKYGVDCKSYWVDEDAGRSSVWSTPLLRRPHIARLAGPSPTKSMRLLSESDPTLR